MTGDAPRVEVIGLAGWRAWLAENHATAGTIWLVRRRKGQPGALSYADARDEALCWGWIDSVARKLDETRTLTRMSPRRPGSPWSGVNKGRVEALRAAGRMRPAGEAAIEVAKADGSWTVLDAASRLAVPDDLAAALAAAGARAAFDGFAPSSRRAILEWVALAKRDATRARRVAETARLAALGLRANHPEAKGR